VARPPNEPSRTRTIYLPPWRIDVVHRPGVEVPIATAALARTAANALAAAGAPFPASLGLILSDDRELAQLNAEHMGEDDPTDVLSFPLLQPSAFPRHPGQDPEARVAASAIEPVFDRPPRQRAHLGDIVLSVERGVAQAEEGRGGQTGDVNWSAADELRLLVTHGVLHVCGWDHARPAERGFMRALEQDILARS
jgi:probable rRNA maturation factor